MTPRIIHMMYFPWDEQQRLREEDEAFDHGDCETMRRYAPDFDVRLWTYSRTRDFCRQYYPSVWEGLKACSRPVMLVDVLRWAVVHHFGGIYWQTNVTPLTEMAAYLPAPGKEVRLFTEFVLSPEQCRAMAAEPIRQGEPEEAVRVLIGVFAASPRSAFVQQTLDFLMERVRHNRPRKDYDILYITGNAAVSTAYDRFGRQDDSVELISLADTRRMLKLHYQGGWRSEARPPDAPPPSPPASPAPRRRRLRLLADAYYRCIRRHPHETMLADLQAKAPRTSCLSRVAPWLDRLGIRTVFEAPCGAWSPLETGVLYTGGDPDRSIVAANRRYAGAGVRFRHVNLLHSRLPQADLFICPDFLEWLPFAEIRRVLHRMEQAKPKYLALTGCPLLTKSWDTALGDYRPLNPRLAPLGFPPPSETIPLTPWANGRTDRRLMVWAGSDLDCWAGSG